MKASSGKILVTGGAGFIGSVVTARLLETGRAVTVLDDLSRGFRDAVPAGAEFVKGGIHQADEVLDSSYSAVVHLAAFAEVAESVRTPERYWWNNTLGTYALLDAMRRAGVHALVFSSTCAVYGEPERSPITEHTPTAPINPYGASKLAADHMIGSECHAHGLAAVSLRYFNVAGAYGRFGERHDPESHLIPLALQVALGRRQRISIYGNDYPTSDGTCVRDYVHVLDLADAHLRALGVASHGRHLVCNLGSSEGYSVRQVIDTVREVTGHAIPAAYEGRRGGDPAVLVASTERARRELGWKPERTSLRQMVHDAWAFARQAPSDSAGELP
ncbi:UDP-glucose 4-epimerase GalE [Streptomyces sp. 6N223]|uniref:UDP-glucose 4-epimerase GalE n=1 Tax=Streptomyces sp. 6N223 TaxID=3457412 RepID=UPI003FD15146